MIAYLDVKRLAPLALALLLGLSSYLLLGQGAQRLLLVALAAAVVGLLVAALVAPWLTLALVPAVIPLGDASVGGGLISAALAASLLVVLLVVAGRLLRGASAPPLPAAGWWMLGLVVVLVLSTPGAASTGLALRQLASTSVGAAMALCVAATCRTHGQGERGVALALAGGGLALAVGVARAPTVSASFGGAVVEGSVGIYSEHNQAGSLGAVLFVLALGAACAATRPWLRVASGVVAVLGLVQTALSLSRGAWIGAVLGVLVLVALAPRVLVPLMIASLTGILLLPVIGYSPVLGVVVQRAGTIGRESPAAADERPAIWREAVREFYIAPVVGQGPGSFPIVAARSDSLAATARPVHAHNVLLTVAAEDGALAVLAVLGLTLAVGRCLWRTVRTSPPHVATLSAGLAGALCTFVGQGLVDVPIRNTSLQVLLWFLVGLALGAGGRVPGDSGELTSDEAGRARV